jgi:uncharacterized protein (DUF1499 family)
MSNFPTIKACRFFFFLLLIMLFLQSCDLSNKRKLGIAGSQLTSCPSSPNCVSSDTKNAEQLVPPFELAVPPERAWDFLLEQVTQIPRTKIVRQDSHYLHVECRSQVFGFVDDIEFHLRPEKGGIAVRSASRTGYFDFGVNRSRIEAFRRALQQRGVVQ